MQQRKLDGPGAATETRGKPRAVIGPPWRLVEVQGPDPASPGLATFEFRLHRAKRPQVRRREGRYLLRSNLCGRNPAELWQFYVQLVKIEAAFKTLKTNLQLRPIFHHLEHRIEAHIFVAFMASTAYR